MITIVRNGKSYNFSTRDGAKRGAENNARIEVYEFIQNHAEDLVIYEENIISSTTNGADGDATISFVLCTREERDAKETNGLLLKLIDKHGIEDLNMIFDKFKEIKNL